MSLELNLKSTVPPMYAFAERPSHQKVMDEISANSGEMEIQNRNNDLKDIAVGRSDIMIVPA